MNDRTLCECSRGDCPAMSHRPLCLYCFRAGDKPHSHERTLRHRLPQEPEFSPMTGGRDD